MRDADSMLLVLPVPFRQGADTLLIEQQACNGLRRWGEHFSHVTVAAPVYPEALARANPSFIWSAPDSLDSTRFTLLALPWGYGYRAFFRSVRCVRRLLGEQIAQHTYLQFGIGYLIGDWAAIAALEAIHQRRRFAIHTDRVEHQLMVEIARTAPLLRRMRTRLMAAAVKHYHRYLIRRCSLGLWHGADCFDEYSRWCAQSHLIHDIHCSPTDAISETELAGKLLDTAGSSALRICYAGRMEPMKAPLEWLQAIAVARDLGASIEAVWYGDGTLRPQMQRHIERLRLNGVVTLPGVIQDRPALLAAIRRAHVMLCTHVTRESARCMLEALLCGTPLVGYRSRFAQDLTTAGGGVYGDLHDWRRLGRTLFELAGERAQLRRLIGEAAASGRRFSDVSVFAERSQLIKRHLPVPMTARAHSADPVSARP